MAKEQNYKEKNGMLILSRKAGQRIMINDDIEILIQSVDTTKSPPQVKVGITASIEHKVDRMEIYLSKKEGSAAEHD